MSIHRAKAIRVVVTFSAIAAIAACGLMIYSKQEARAQENPGASALTELSNAFNRVAETASNGVVAIRIEKKMTIGGGMVSPNQPMDPREFFRRFFGAPGDMGQGQGGQQEQSVPYAQGTGFVVTQDGYIATNAHVVDGADRVVITFNDGKEMEAKIIGSDDLTEVALLKVEATGLAALPMGDSDNIRVGDWVIAIGSPFGLSQSVTSGIISARSRSNTGIGGPDFYADFIQTDAAINPGNSGGPLLNLKGEVIGMNTAILSRTGGYMGIGFAVPINVVRYIQEQLQTSGKVTRGYLGISIQNLTPEIAPSFNVAEKSGVLIADISPDSPALKAGLQRDDIIIEFAGKPVNDSGSFRSRVMTTTPGATVDITVLRNGERLVKQVEVGSLAGDVRLAAKSGGMGPNQMDEIGITIQNLTPAIAQSFGVTDEAGVIITDVARASVADMAGLQPGMLIVEVNRTPVTNVGEFQALAQKAKESGNILLRVKDGQYSRYVGLRLNK